MTMTTGPCLQRRDGSLDEKGPNGQLALGLLAEIAEDTAQQHTSLTALR